MISSSRPLVSVIVITYNASKYILETLESVKAQTYENIELIVSDDGSVDKTVDLANEWIKLHSDRFKRVEVITVDHNTGVSANYNRAVQACEGEWIKNVDGDDLITPNCVADNVDYVLEHPEIKLLFSDVVVFKESVGKELYRFSDSDFRGFFDMSADGQFRRLIQRNFLPSTPMFAQSSLLRSYKYNEKYKGLEDFPMWVQLTKNGHKAYYLDAVTAMYRKDDSMTKSKKRLYSSFYMDSMEMFFWGELYGYLKDCGDESSINYYMKQFMLYHLAVVVFKNKGRFVYRALFSALRKILACE